MAKSNTHDEQDRATTQDIAAQALVDYPSRSVNILRAESASHDESVVEHAKAARTSSRRTIAADE
jgi:hypothetical protein